MNRARALCTRHSASWRSWTEIRWLAVCGIGVTVFFATFAPDGQLAPDDRRDLIFALLVDLAGAFGALQPR